MKYFCVVAMSEKPEIAVAAEKIKKYLEDRGIPVPVKKDDSYSRDRNIWHIRRWHTLAGCKRIAGNQNPADWH